MVYIGVALLGIAFLISIASNIWFLVEGFKVSVGWGIGLLLGGCLCGIPQLIFLVKYWKEAWPPFVCCMFGSLAPGLVGYYIVAMEDPGMLATIMGGQ